MMVGMFVRRILLPGLIAGALTLTALSVRAEEPAGDREGVEFFEAKIRPVLVEHCYECHSVDVDDDPEGGLLLDTREGIRKGGDSGPAVVPGDPAAGRLLQALRYENDLEMPPDEKLPPEVVANFEAWIRRGAPDPRDGPAVITAEPKPPIDLAAARQFWAFQPPQRHPAPAVGEGEAAAGAIDAFVLAKLREAGLTAGPEADRRTLIRRVTFDLVGLPPTPEEVEAFVADESPDAYERLVDRLLASPRYGERWARPWLDLARYAEDQAHIVGEDKSLFYPNAYLYRDWVIAALNADVPYDRFVRLQLAADLVEPVDESQLAALGFIGLGPKYYRRNAPEVMAEEWEDRVDVVGRGLLGLTVACARCHDHKFEPIATEDYYALAGVFASTEMFNRPLDPNAEKKEDGEAKEPEQALHIIRDDEPKDLNVYIRGDVNSKGPVAQRRFLPVLCDSEPPRFQMGSGRAELARALVDRGNPLVARVFVNRIWALNFGRPLVGTPSDFGHTGEPPTHPELLDDLAARFMDSDWSIKGLQREMVLSAAYRRSSADDPAKRAVDPENRLLWRMNRRRLDVEQWRDAVLADSGRLVERIGGKSIEPDEPDSNRRTVYSGISRFKLNPMLALFDFPDPNAHSAQRNRTTTPLQKLFVMNNPFVTRQAEETARRLSESTADDDVLVLESYRTLFGREPTEEEVRLGREFLAGPAEGRVERQMEYAQALLASNEMLMLD